MSLLRSLSASWLTAGAFLIARFEKGTFALSCCGFAGSSVMEKMLFCWRRPPWMFALRGESGDGILGRNSRWW